MKLLYAGTPEFAVRPLQALVAAGFEVVGVVTQPDKPQGRKNILTPPPVKVTAESLGLPVVQPQKIKAEISLLREFSADGMVTCAYGQILSQEVLDVFPKGVWNIHAGLLPKYRGASPIQSSILAGVWTIYFLELIMMLIMAPLTKRMDNSPKNFLSLRQRRSSKG